MQSCQLGLVTLLGVGRGNDKWTSLSTASIAMLYVKLCAFRDRGNTSAYFGHFHFPSQLLHMVTLQTHLHVEVVVTSLVPRTLLAAFVTIVSKTVAKKSCEGEGGLGTRLGGGIMLYNIKKITLTIG